MSETFVEGIAGISFQNGMVKIDYASQSMPGEPGLKMPVKDGEQAPPPVAIRQRLVMPLGAFLNALGAQQSVVEQLIEKGVLQRREQQEAAKQAPSAEALASFSAGEAPKN